MSGSWSQTPVQKRSDIMLRAAELLESRLDEFAVAESRDQGKPVWLSKSVDIPRAVYNLRCFATSVLHHVDTYAELQTLYYTVIMIDITSFVRTIRMSTQFYK